MELGSFQKTGMVIFILTRSGCFCFRRTQRRDRAVEDPHSPFLSYRKNREEKMEDFLYIPIRGRWRQMPRSWQQVQRQHLPLVQMAVAMNMPASWDIP